MTTCRIFLSVFTIAIALTALAPAAATAEIPADASATSAKRTNRVSRLRRTASGEIRLGTPVPTAVTVLREPISIVSVVAKPAVFIYIERADIKCDELQRQPEFTARIPKDARKLGF